MYLDGNLSPIGWSRIGYIAYAYVYTTYEPPKQHVCFITIFNTVTDEVIDTFTNIIHYPNEFRDYYELDDMSFEEFWTNNKDGITRFLKKYDIVSFPNINLESIDTLNQQYGLEVVLVKAENEIRITIVNNTGKEKIVSTESFFRSVKVLGFYKSPFEERVVLYIEGIGPIGPGIFGEYYKFIGCHLTAGF
jgi:hypothetical protein